METGPNCAAPPGQTTLQEAIEAPRVWTEGTQLELEKGFPDMLGAADLAASVRPSGHDGALPSADEPLALQWAVLAQLSPYQTQRLKRFGDYSLSMNSPDPFETELVVPLPLEDAQEPAVSA